MERGLYAQIDDRYSDGLTESEHPRGRARVDLSAVFFQHSLMENSMLSALKARKDSIAGDRPGALVVPCSGDGEAV